MKTRTLLALAATCAALAACGGGGSEGGDQAPPAPNTVPQSAVGSVTGLISYLQSLIAGSNDTAQPVSLDGVTLPVDDTGPSAAI